MLGADPTTGRVIVRASWIGTALLAASAGFGLAFHPAVWITFGTAVALFAAGAVALLAAYARAIGRSREDEIALAGLFFLAGSAPRDVQRQLIGAFLIQVVIAFAAAAAGVNTLVATAILAPVFGLAMMGLWGARHGSFPPRSRPLR